MKRVTIADAVTVNAGDWSPVYAVPVKSLPPAVRDKLEAPANFLVECNKAWSAEIGMADARPTSIATCDLYETLPGQSATTGYRSKAVPFYPGQVSGYAWIRVKNDGVAAATLSIDVWE